MIWFFCDKMKTIKILLSGTVQGVFFRDFVKENADTLSVRGFVRNLDDGRLEIVAEGRDEIVGEFLTKCREGPNKAHIKNFETKELKHQGFDSFKILSL